MTTVTAVPSERDKSVSGFALIPVGTGGGFDPPVEVDVLVVAFGFLGDLQLHIEQLAEMLWQFGQLVQIEPAQVQVGLDVLQSVRGEDAVAPQEPVHKPRRQNSQRPLEHRITDRKSVV